MIQRLSPDPFFSARFSEILQHFSDNFSGSTSNKSLTGTATYIAETWAGNGQATGIFSKTGGYNASLTPGNPDTSPTGRLSINASHDHTFSGSVSGNTGNPSDRGTDSQGSSATNTNLPPYYALCYIMKT